METMTTLVGYAAACCTTFAFVPQVLHTWKTRDLSGVSLGMYAVFTVGIFAWLAYGILQQDWPIILANIVTGSLSSSILYMKLQHLRQTTEIHQ